MSRFKLDGLNLDANESAFLARGLEAVRAGVLDVKYGMLKAADLVPVNTSIDPGAVVWTYEYSDQAGVAHLIHDMSNDIPTVEVVNGEVQSKIRSIAAKYVYTVQDVRSARLSGRQDLQISKAAVARRAIAQRMDDIMLLGDGTDAYLGLRGLFKLAGTATYTIPNGAGGSPLWTNKTADEILADLYGACNKVEQGTLENYSCNALAVSLAGLNIMKTKRVGDTGRTVLAEFRENMPGVTVTASTKLSTAGSGSGQRLVAYHKSPEVLEGIAPVLFEQFAPQAQALRVETPCHARTGGVVLYQPLAVVYADGY